MSTPSHSQGAENPQPVPIPADVVANQGNESYGTFFLFPQWPIRIPYSESQSKYLVDAAPRFECAVLAGTVQQFLVDFYDKWFARYPEDPKGDMFDEEQDEARVYWAKTIFEIFHMLLGQRWSTTRLAGDIGLTQNILTMMDRLTQMIEEDWLSDAELGFSGLAVGR